MQRLEGVEPLEPRLPMEMPPGLVRRFGSISLDVCDMNDPAAVRAQQFVKSLPSKSYFGMGDIVRTKDKAWTYEMKDCVGLFAINAKGEMVVSHSPRWEVSEKSAVERSDGSVINRLMEKCAEGMTIITKYKEGIGWCGDVEKKGNLYGLQTGGPQTITDNSELEHIYPEYRNYEKVTVEFKNGRKVLVDYFMSSRNYLHDRGMWNDEDEVWLQEEMRKLGPEEFIQDRKIIEYFSGMPARITMRGLRKQVQELGKDTELYIVGGNAFRLEQWKHYKEAVRVFDAMAMQSTGRHATILTPPSMKTVDKDYDFEKSYLFDPEGRRAYAFGFSKIVEEGKTDVLPFGVPAEWVDEVYAPFFEKFRDDQ